MKENKKPTITLTITETDDGFHSRFTSTNEDNLDQRTKTMRSAVSRLLHYPPEIALALMIAIDKEEREVIESVVTVMKEIREIEEEKLLEKKTGDNV